MREQQMFDLCGIRKSLPPTNAGRRAKTNCSKRRSALRGAVAAAALHQQEEDELAATLSRSVALRMQRVSVARDVTTACIMLSPEHLPLPAGARVHFRLESERITPRESRSSLVVASVGSVSKHTDRPLVVKSRSDPCGGSCEIVVLNSGDVPIFNSFSMRFTIFCTASASATGTAGVSDDVAVGAWVLRDGVRWYGCATCRRRKPQDAFSQQNPANGLRNYRQTMQCDDCAAGSSQVAAASEKG